MVFNNMTKYIYPAGDKAYFSVKYARSIFYVFKNNHV